MAFTFATFLAALRGELAARKCAETFRPARRDPNAARDEELLRHRWLLAIDRGRSLGCPGPGLDRVADRPIAALVGRLNPTDTVCSVPSRGGSRRRDPASSSRHRGDWRR